MAGGHGRGVGTVLEHDDVAAGRRRGGRGCIGGASGRGARPGGGGSAGGRSSVGGGRGVGRRRVGGRRFVGRGRRVGSAVGSVGVGVGGRARRVGAASGSMSATRWADRRWTAALRRSAGATAGRATSSARVRLAIDRRKRSLRFDGGPRRFARSPRRAGHCGIMRPGSPRPTTSRPVVRVQPSRPVPTPQDPMGVRPSLHVRGRVRAPGRLVPMA